MKGVREGLSVLFSAVLAISAQADLPEGYVPLEYVETDGAQYVNTGFTPEDSEDGFELDFIYRDAIGTGGKRILGSSNRNPDGNGWFVGAYQAATAESGGQMFFCGLTKDPGIRSNVRMTLKVVQKTYETSAGDRIDLSAAASKGFNGSVHLASVNVPSPNANLYASCTIYGFKLYRGSEVIHDFVPVKNATGEPGLYDVVGDLGFRSSATLSPLTAGPEKGVEPVKPEEGLPEGYGQLKFIDSNGRQYLNTGFVPQSANFGFSLDFVYYGTVGPDGKRILGSSDRSQAGNGLFIGAWQSEKSECGGQLYFCGITGNAYVRANTRMTLSVTNGCYTTSEGDVLDVSAASGTGFNGAIHLASVNVPSADESLYAPCRFYGLRFYQDAALVHDFVPVTNANGVAGLYDVKGNLGFKRSATGIEFAAGPGTDTDDPDDPERKDLKTVSILGDSYSSFYGWSDDTYPYYPALDVYDVRQMWWRILENQLNVNLGVCEAVSGTTISYVKDKNSSFIARCWRSEPTDMWLILGGSNDQAQGAEQGEYIYDPLLWTNETLAQFRPACAALLSRLRGIYPKARIYFIANAPATSDADVYLQPAYIESIRTVCAHYGVPCVELKDIDRQDRHPTAAGMQAIASQVSAFIAQDEEERAKLVYSDPWVKSNDPSLRCVELKGERVYVSTAVDRDVKLVVRRPMRLNRLLLVGGGGCGGQTIGGGGGGGNVVDRTEEIDVPKGTEFVLTVGAGGDVPMPTAREKSSDRVSPDANYWQYGVSGTDSVLTMGKNQLARAGGGGGGGGWSTGTGADNGYRNYGRSTDTGGATGGGAHAGNAGTARGGGFEGGKSAEVAAGGGGGAGGAGIAGSGSVSGDGGAGVVSDITGVSVEYGAGGGGGAGNTATTAGRAGGVSAGAGATVGQCGQSGVDGLGGGGGGGSYDAEGYGYVGGKGGDGTVILRFACKSTGFAILVY